MSTLLLQAAEVAMQRGARRVLQGIDLTVSAGEVVALIGPNGAGKSSLLQALAGLLPVSHGHIAVQGNPLADWSLPALARARAYLAQHATVQWPLPVRDIVALGRLPFASHQQFGQKTGAAISADADTGFETNVKNAIAADAAAITQAMTAADVIALAERPVTRLSEGEKARVLIARLLATGAPLLLADEPTAALDLAHQHQLMQLFRRHADNGGGAVLVLHDLNLAARYCDRLLLLQAGTLCAAGSPAEVLTAARLAEVYGVSAELLLRDGVLQLLTSASRCVTPRQ